jgi:Trk K+ transport system NAD-binding subunit
MPKKIALVFGYNKYAFEIVQNVQDKYERVTLYAQKEDEIDEVDKVENHIEYFDLSDDWSDISQAMDPQKSIAFCVLEDNAENIFLTISLRAHFSDLTIVAIASNKENANKLSMAGANKVIPIVETTADIIANILELPISNKVLHNILFEKNDLKISQIKIGKNCKIKDEEIVKIEWSRYKGVIVLSLMHKDMKSEFIYASKLKHHILTEGDTLVVVGYEQDIIEFKQLIESE